MQYFFPLKSHLNLSPDSKYGYDLAIQEQAIPPGWFLVSFLCFVIILYYGLCSDSLFVIVVVINWCFGLIVVKSLVLRF